MAVTSDVVIIGGGATGCAVAYFLAKAGVKPTIMESQGIGSGASGYSAGGLNPLQGAAIPGALEALAIKSFRIHQEIWDEIGSESGVEFYPKSIAAVKVAFDESDLSELNDTLNIFEAADGFSAHWMESDDIYEMEPRIASGVIRGLYTYGNAALDSYSYTLALSKSAEKLGATIRSATVRGLKTSSGRVTGVFLEDGEIECENIVIASGPWSTKAEGWLGIPIPIAPLKGEILRTELPGNALAQDLSSNKVSLWPRADGLVWIGATEESRGFDSEPSESARRLLLAAAVELMPAMADATVVKHTACLRPITPDWLPIIGVAPSWENVYLATGSGKKGILISPGMGRAIADLITQGITDLPIGPFAPDRFNKLLS